MTAPLVYALVELQQKGSPLALEFEQMLKRKCEGDGDVPKAVDILMNSAGIEVADRLSIDHIKESVINLREVRDERVSDGGGLVLDFEEKHA